VSSRSGFDPPEKDSLTVAGAAPALLQKSQRTGFPFHSSEKLSSEHLILLVKRSNYRSGARGVSTIFCAREISGAK
jgi:hypothetical protein